MTGSGTSFEITVNTGSEEGELGLEFLGGDAVTDFAGNGVNSTTEFYTVDRRQPIPNLETAGGSPTNSNSIAFTVDFNEPVFGFDQGDVSISSGSVSNFAGSTDSYSFDVEGATDGDALLVQVPAGGAMDAGGNLNEASQQISLAIDRTNPTLLITLDGTSPTNSDAIIFDLEFSESVVGLSNDDLSTSGSLSSAVKFGITGSDANYQITATLGDGTVDGTISLIVSGDVSDPAGNGLDPTESALVEVDNTAPIAVLADRVDPSPTNLTTVLFNVQFSEPVSGFSDEDTELIAPDLSGTTVSDVTPFGESGFIVSVFTGTGTGPLQLRVLDDDSVADAAGNVLGGAGAGNGELDGETYFINEGDLGPTGLTTQQIIDFLNGENPYGFDSSLFDVNQDGVIDAADAVANGL